MKKLSVLLLAGLLILASCLPWGNAGQKESPAVMSAASSGVSSEPLCAEQAQALDFAVLDEAREIIRAQSIFKEAAADTGLLLRGAFSSFFATIFTSQSQIPQWASDMIEQEIKNGDSARFSILGDVQQRLVEEGPYYDKNLLIKNSISGMLKALGDNWGGYLTPRRWQADKGNFSGRYRGIGVKLEKNDQGKIIIDTVFAGSPAQKAGILEGDVILEIDNKYLTPECSTEDVAFKIRVREDPKITIKTRRGRAEEKLFEFEAQEIILKPIASSPVVDFSEGRGTSNDGYPYSQHPFKDKDGRPVEDILYVKIKEFTDQSAIDLGVVLLTLNPRKFRSIIIDLRGNLGGVTSSASISVGFFLEKGFIFFGEGRNYSMKHYLTEGKLHVEGTDGKPLGSRQPNIVPQNIPIAVITGTDNKDNNSHSAAEIFAAALRDNKRAIIVSREERTGGKGTFNWYYPIKNGEGGALYLSIGFWKTPNGEIIQGRGIEPDIRVDWSEADYKKNKENADYDPTLFVAIEYLRTQSQTEVAR